MVIVVVGCDGSKVGRYEGEPVGCLVKGEPDGAFGVGKKVGMSVGSGVSVNTRIGAPTLLEGPT